MPISALRYPDNEYGTGDRRQLVSKLWQGKSEKVTLFLAH
jgi:hypothetical protein